MLFPAVIVHGLDDAQAALAPRRPVTLLSAPGAAVFGGCLWWRSLMAAAGYEGVSLLDCADAAGRAAEALRLGLPGVVLSPRAPSFAVVQGLARDAGALILPAPPPRSGPRKKWCGAAINRLDWMTSPGRCVTSGPN